MAEQWIKEGTYAFNCTRLSCHRFKDNQVRLQLFVVAYILRRLALPASVKQWALMILRQKLIKIGARMIHHARYVTFQMVEVTVDGGKALFRQILNRIRRLGVPPPLAATG